MAVRRFTLIVESDARHIEAGTTVELEAGGHITPLAADTLRERRVTVVPLGTVDPALPADLGPAHPVQRVVIGADHSGVTLKAAIVAHLRGQGVAVEDLGTYTQDPVDYPDVAAGVARSVARGEADGGIVIDGAGLGSTMAANKVRGVRAAMCTSVTLARYARAHNGANVLALGSTLVDVPMALAIVDTWRGTPMIEARYLRRLLKMRRLEERS